MKETFYLNSSDKKNDLHCILWKPEGEVSAVLQIIHGMKEYIDRYDGLAGFLNDNGIAVIGCDHLGHGQTVPDQESLGFFAEKGGKGYLLQDQHLVSEKAGELFPKAPLFVLGHSMGSFILRRYITIWGGEIDGAIIMGTGTEPFIKCSMGKFLTYILMKIKGPKYRSKFIFSLADGNYSKAFEGGVTWLSKNEENVKKYMADPFCTYQFTLGAYHTLFSLMEDMALRKNDRRIPKDLPVLFLSGMDDIVGAYTKGVLKAYNEYVSLGLLDVNVKFYSGDRHEILNEDDRDVVYRDVQAFIADRS